MAKIISFAWTTPALLAGRKTCTRRNWDRSYALSFYEGESVQAWNTSPRNVRARPRQLAWIRLIATPCWEPLERMPDSDYEAEGFAFLAQQPRRSGGPVGDASWESFQKWRDSGESMWVVRFKLKELL